MPLARPKTLGPKQRKSGLLPATRSSRTRPTRVSGRSSRTKVSGRSSSNESVTKPLSSSSEKSCRRSGYIWSRDSSRKEDLHSVPLAAEPLKSCMKVPTLEDSLRKASRRGPGSPFRQSFRLHKSNRALVDDGMAPGRMGLRERVSNSLKGMKHPFHTDRGREHKENAALQTAVAGEGSAASPVFPQRPSRVRFDRLQIREYDVLAVDNPGVSKGPAVGLDWQYVEGPEQAVDEFESSHPPRRKLKEIKMSKKERERRLLASGVTKREMKNIMVSIQKAKDKRMETLENLDQSKSEELKEAIMKKLKIMLHLRKRYEEAEDDLWESAHKDTLLFVGD